MHYERKGLRLWGVMLAVFLLLAGVNAFTVLTTVTAKADTQNGFVTEGNYTYYYVNGTKYKGWLTLNGEKYYFTSGKGVMVTGWVTDKKGNKRYFNKETGVMATGWVRFPGGKRYFNPATGVMKTRWLKLNENRYYFDKSTGYAASGFTKISGKYRYFYSQSCALARGWLTNSKGDKRYFYSSSSASKDGVMATSFSTIDGKNYYFYTSSGKMATGWVTNSVTGNRYYFDTHTGEMATGTITIDGTSYTFTDEGILVGGGGGGTTAQTDGSKTIKNYLLGALQPVGKALYVWGGGWNDSTRKGVSPTWVSWYASQSSSYDYRNYNDLSSGNRAKGLDCSGFVGWAAYQVMHTESGEGSGYTVVSGEVGSWYKSLGWGSIINQNYLSNHNYTLKAGDVGYNDGHVWIVIGQCPDKSVVLVHSTPQAGCQISGTCTPSGGYDSQAVSLASKYMAKMNVSDKYEYHNSAGNYIPRYNYLRWNRSTLADPDGYMNMTAAQILADLFS